MISNGIYLVLNDVWGLVKLNFMFLAFSLLGGVVLGVGPAMLMVNDLILEYRLQSQQITWREGFERWKANFIRGNQIFYLYVLISAVLIYNLYICVQIKGLAWLILSFLLLFFTFMIGMVFLYMININSSFEISIVNLFKLSFATVFLNLGTFIKLITMIGLVLFLSWKMKGLLLFMTFSGLLFLTTLVIKKQVAHVRLQLIGHE
ncbi:YesL family protein [Vagococcus zengguangii]|uniref:DUF624 domain-containing protein n=1 Tax=Vagococcus zengguangii TaxID=2571750 RepID=A0A4D7CW10_9ENTE|nr:DUF624 domain-containing protein [Vagococcus zengguangii]QCI86206.1 DUF624 domain-containing protein [Vagococcus zengguangii]